ncbi:uncharacterized protein B0T15DRAFT_568643 [Chaetomium strumarium]|uniref:Glycosyl transferase n=1 Tax=Chaetomium strumarium TaxID=1170767 RepID=A0AAJ0GMV0_9PEZI|nr:hypothetical protein B0T15DRAFT_568643 [Chaetomium strumarium]
MPMFTQGRTRLDLSPPPPACTNRAPDDDVIPNQVHFVYILKNTSHDFNFEFSHFLSIYAAWHYWRPQAIYLHTNVAADSRSVARARNGTAGKWNHYIFTFFNLTVHEVDVPTHAGNGVELQNIEHKSDFVRVKALYELGGVYIDFDVHPLRNIRPLRESGFRAIAGRQLGGQINSGTFMTARGGKLARLWMEQMHVAYTGGWTTHSNEVITRVGQRLVREPGEMLIMEQDAFAPGSWKDEDTDALFAVHGDAPSNLPPNDTSATTDVKLDLPSHDEAFADRWDHPERFPEWERDWSHTYLLHAFTPDRWHHKVPGFDHITPRYVLERRSNFARAVYPVAKVLLDQGLIGVEDSHTGL